MKIIGLTGGSGAGKTAVANVLKGFGAFVIDCDDIARKVVKPNKPAYLELINIFGKIILNHDNTINRKVLGEIAFTNEDNLAKLNLCTHKYILAEVDLQIKTITDNPGEYTCIVIDAALLIETNLHKKTDEVWLVVANEKIQQQRIIERDSITYEQAKMRLKNQTAVEEHMPYADVIIENNDDFTALENNVRKKI